MKKVVWFLVISLILMSLIMVSCSQPSPTPSKAPTSQAPSTQAPSTQAPSTQAPSTSKPPSTSAPPSSSATSPAAGGVIKIGHIRPMTGNMAMTSDMMIKAFDFAFQQVNYQVAGKQIQIIVGDSQGLPEKTIDVARKMVENDKVALIAGPIQGGESQAAASYMNQVGIPEVFTNPQPMSQLNGKWTILAGGTEAQHSSAMGVYAYDQLGYRKVDVLTEDNADGHEFLNAFMNAFKKKGGQIVQEQYPPYPSQDFSTYLTVLKPADAVVSWFDGDQAIKFLIQYHQMSINKKFPLVGAFHGAFLAPFILRVIPPEIANATVGYPVPTPYSPSLDTAFNKKWVSDFQAKFNGIIPDDTSSGPYQGAMAIIRALQATNGDTTPDKLRQAILAQTFEGPEGSVKFDPQTGCSIKTMYICKISKQGNDFGWQPVFSYKDVPPNGF